MFNIEGLIKEHSMFFQVFKIEYLNKYVAFLVSNTTEGKKVQLSLINYSSENKDTIYHLNRTEWFPLTIGDTFQQATDNLEKKLNIIPVDYLESWNKNVSLGYSQLLK